MARAWFAETESKHDGKAYIRIANLPVDGPTSMILRKPLMMQEDVHAILLLSSNNASTAKVPKRIHRA